jgi:hypothetical protein
MAKRQEDIGTGLSQVKTLESSSVVEACNKADMTHAAHDGTVTITLYIILTPQQSWQGKREQSWITWH